MQIQFAFDNPAVKFPDGNSTYVCSLLNPPRIGDYVTFDPEGGNNARVEVVSWVLPGSHAQPGFSTAMPTYGPDVYVVLRSL